MTMPNDGYKVYDDKMMTMMIVAVIHGERWMKNDDKVMVDDSIDCHLNPIA